MGRLVRFFVERYVFSISIFLAIAFFGLSAAVRLGVDLLPEFDIPIVAVNTTYAGAGSEETATQLSEPIEDAIATIPGVTGISSFSGEGYSFVVAQFDYEVDVDQAAIDVKQRVDALRDALPDDAGDPIVQKFDPNDEPILDLALSGPGVDPRELQAYAENTLEPRLQGVRGVADVAVVGPVQREVQVLLDPGRLASYGLSPAQVAGAIDAASVTLPAGTLDLGDERIVLSVRTAPEGIEEVASMLVDPSRGLRVRDLAVVRDAATAPAAYVRLDGEPVVMLEVRKVSGANSVSTARALRAELEAVDLPEGYAVRTVGDTTVFVENAVLDTFRETALAVVAVALVVLLFVGRLGSAFSVVLAIPITLTGAVIVFGLLGFTFNIVTLLAITVAVGLVVDDSIVIAENIERWRERGLPPKEAVYKGAGEVSTAVLTATLSLLAVFLPISFLPGIIGQFFSQFGLALAATIVVSYLEAMFFLTVRLAYLPNPLPPSWGDLARAPSRLLPDGRRAAGLWRRRRTWALALLVGVAAPYALDALGRTPALPLAAPYDAFAVGAVAAIAALALLPVAAFALAWLVGRVLLGAIGALLRSGFRATDALVGRLRDGYARALAWSLRRSGAVLAAAGLVLASLFWIFPRIDFSFVRPVDAGIVSVSLEMPPGSSLERTDAAATVLEDALRDLPEARAVQATVGSGGPTGASNATTAALTVELTPPSERRRDSFAIADALREELGEALASTFPEGTLEVSSSDGGAVPVETGIELTLESTDRELLEARDEIARRVMRDSPWLRNAGSSLEGSVSERVFVLDPAALAGTGLTASEVASTLRAYNVGLRAADLRQGGDEVPIRVRVDPSFVRDEQTLLSLPVFSPTLRSFLPLGELGRFEVRAAPVVIERAGQAYVSTLTADLTAGAPGQFQVRSELEAALAGAGVTDELVALGTGVGPDLLGDLVFYGPIAFALALLLNYLVIASQFNSFKVPLYLLVTVPLALVGAFWLFWLTGSSLDVISVLGIVILVGLVTKNAILLLDVVFTQHREGEGLAAALVRAGRLRLRPILMTALTVVIISLPLLMGLGEGSEFRRPLGLVILGGVLSSTVLTLFVVPAAFYRFERGRYPEAGAAGAAGSPAAARGERSAADAPDDRPARIPGD